MKNSLSSEKLRERTISVENDVRGAYFRDQTAIIHSLAFRRLKHKTQVFLAPENDHICTRIEHVLHVATIAVTICKGLNISGWQLDSEMAFAIGLGHDLGHPPFGHDGESILNKLVGKERTFIHEINSYRVVEHLSNKGKGLNLTYGVKDGIICHNGEKFEQELVPLSVAKDLSLIKNRSNIPSTFEGCIMRFADKIAYLGRDVEDAITANLIKRGDIPKRIAQNIGVTNSQVIDTLVNEIINCSKNNNKICLSNEMYELMKEFRNFNYEHIYFNESRLRSKPFAEKVLTTLYEYITNLFKKNQFDIEKYLISDFIIDREFGNYLCDMEMFYSDEEDKQIIIIDYIAGMTDLFAMKCMKEITFPPSLFFGKKPAYAQI